MRANRKFMLPVLVVLSCVLLPGCPPKVDNTTFPYYVLNFTPTPLTQLKFPDGNSETLQFVNVLDSPVPAFKLRVLHLDRARFGETLSEVEWKLQDGTANSISARITVGPGELGFLVREFNNGIVGTIYEAELDAKGLPLDISSL